MTKEKKEFKSVSVSIPRELLAAVDKLAEKNRRSRSNMIAELLREEMEIYTSSKTKPAQDDQ